MRYIVPLSAYLSYRTYKYAAPLAGLAPLGLILALLSFPFYDKISSELYTLSTWKDSGIEYFRELQVYKKLSDKRKNHETPVLLEKYGKERTTILVIGESHNKNHMSLYGYPRKTTPLLDNRHDAGELIAFSHAYSNHTHTDKVLSLALTQANQYNGVSWAQSPSIIDVSNQLNIQTHWLSNQQMLGVWDNSVSLIAKQANNVVAANKMIGKHKQPKNHDDILFTPLKEALASKGEKLIIVHLFGNHGNYCLRYPEDWKNYTEPLTTAIYGEAVQTAQGDTINCYDNSVTYNDYILDEIINISDSAEHEQSVSMLYFADHSEDVLTGALHNQAVFTYAMIDIPMLFWANNKWKSQNKQSWDQIQNNRKQVFTNDLVYETVIGIMGYRGEHIPMGNDISHPEFSQKEKPTTLHGRVEIDSPHNTKYWQSKNAAQIIKSGLEHKLLPHRVNTIGKLHNISYDQLNAFEVDVIYRNDNSNPFFEVGHDEGAMSGISLDSFLTSSDHKYKKIWLDVKNVRDKDIEGMIQRLENLNQSFDFKNQLIIETSNRSDAPKKFAESGYHLSYYLPTRKVLSVLNESEEVKVETAQALVRIAKSQNASAVSFDLKLYSFVKSHIEPLLDPGIVFHTWFPGYTLWESGLLEKLRTQSYFNDPKVKTILLPYYSPFSL